MTRFLLLSSRAVALLAFACSAESPGGPSGGSAGLATGGTNAIAATGGSGARGGNVAGSSAAGASGASGERAGWTLVFQEEFDGTRGTPVNTDHWNLVNRGDGFGNNELQYYTNRPENAALDGQGSLAITAIREPYMSREYTSARLESNGKVTLTYGRVEGRLKLPRGPGIWPAFWMLGSNFASAGWPDCGEIDIMENIGKEPSITHGTLHGPGYSGASPLGADYALPDGQRFADDFHVFAIEWEKDVVRFYVDDQLFKTRTPADVPAGGRWVYDHSFYLLLNVAVGGNWPGPPDASTTFPQTLLVDYVRVYRR